MEALLFFKALALMMAAEAKTSEHNSKPMTRTSFAVEEIKEPLT